ncbi:MAG: glycosyltransferase [Chlamydiota bacterium]|nr:glycosyltransferase [Chlamydiota bacterium]
MSENTLVIITSAYPFTDRELFIEKELEYHLKKFTKIILVPLRIDSERRPVPDNVEVFTDICIKNSDTSFLGYLRKLARVLSSPYFYKEIFFSPKRVLNFKNLRYIIGFLSYALEGVHSLKKLITLRKELKHATFYSYWMHVHSCCLAILKQSYPKIKIVSRAHGYDIYEEDYSPPFIPLRKMTLSSIEKVFTVSENGKLYLEKRGVCGEKIEVSNLGVPSPNFKTNLSNDGVFSLVSCAYLISLKRVDKIIDSVAKFAKNNPRITVKWNHLGGGELYQSLLEQAASDLPENVAWKIHGEVSNEFVYEFYKDNSVDVFISISASEGLPVSMMEALSCGIPIISSNVGGVSELVTEHTGSLLSENPECAEIVVALQYYLQNRGELVVKQNNAIELWKSKFDQGKNYQNFVDQL